MIDTAPASAILSDEEIEAICRTRKQGAAQIRYLRALGLRVERRPDGSPLVWRADIERREQAQNQRTANGPKWRAA